VVPVIPVAQQLAEKVHAYLRSYGNGSSRPRDLYDMLVIAEQLPVPRALTLVETCRETFAIRETASCLEQLAHTAARWTRDGIEPHTKGRPCGRP
jgi:hypothetical protein